eukprot:scaffold86129_cov37-Tisochrysis_lutea.AAC.1
MRIERGSLSERRGGGNVYTPRERRADVRAKEACVATLVNVGHNALGKQDCHVQLALAQRLGHRARAAWEVGPLDRHARLLEATGERGCVPRRVEVLGDAAHAKRCRRAAQARAQPLERAWH